jgi:acyl-ACP thioesterase
MTDQLTAGITHEVVIDGEKSWIKLEYTTEIMSGETPEIARERAHSFVDDGVLKSIQQTVETVRKVNR